MIRGINEKSNKKDKYYSKIRLKTLQSIPINRYEILNHYAFMSDLWVSTVLNPEMLHFF